MMCLLFRSEGDTNSPVIYTQELRSQTTVRDNIQASIPGIPVLYFLGGYIRLVLMLISSLFR